MIELSGDWKLKHLIQCSEARAVGKKDEVDDFSKNGGEADLGSR
jgi:hypothetical protein